MDATSQSALLEAALRRINADQVGLLAESSTGKTTSIPMSAQFVSQSERRFVCNYRGCNKVFVRPGSLREHQECVHEGKRYPCDFPGCTYVATQKRHLNSHQREHTGTLLRCTRRGCPYKTKQPAYLKRHLKTHAGNSSIPSLKDVTNSQETQTSCDIQATVQSESSTRGATKANAFEAYSNENNMNHLRCDFAGCTFVTTARSTLKAHERQHTGKVFRCSFAGCSFTATRRDSVNRHRRGVHEGGYPCDFPGCGHVSTRGHDLKRHKERLHSGKTMSPGAVKRRLAAQKGLETKRRKSLSVNLSGDIQRTAHGNRTPMSRRSDYDAKRDIIGVACSGSDRKTFEPSGGDIGKQNEHSNEFGNLLSDIGDGIDAFISGMRESSETHIHAESFSLSELSPLDDMEMLPSLAGESGDFINLDLSPLDEKLFSEVSDSSQDRHEASSGLVLCEDNSQEEPNNLLSTKDSSRIQSSGDDECDENTVLEPRNGHSSHGSSADQCSGDDEHDENTVLVRQALLNAPNDVYKAAKDYYEAKTGAREAIELVRSGQMNRDEDKLLRIASRVVRYGKVFFELRSKKQGIPMEKGESGFDQTMAYILQNEEEVRAKFQAKLASQATCHGGAVAG